MQIYINKPSLSTKHTDLSYLVNHTGLVSTMRNDQLSMVTCDIVCPARGPCFEVPVSKRICQNQRSNMLAHPLVSFRHFLKQRTRLASFKSIQAVREHTVKLQWVVKTEPIVHTLWTGGGGALKMAGCAKTHLVGSCMWSCALHRLAWHQRRCRCCDRDGRGRRRIPRKKFQCCHPHTRRRKYSAGDIHTKVLQIRTWKKNLWNWRNGFKKCQIIQWQNIAVTSDSGKVWFSQHERVFW